MVCSVVCSAYGGWNDIGGDAFHLQRVHGDPVFARFSNMLTFDPRLANVAKYDYSIDPADEPTLEQLRQTIELANAKPIAPLPTNLEIPRNAPLSSPTNLP